MKIGMTGTRSGMSEYQKSALINYLIENRKNIIEAHHGDCVGADAEFHSIVQRYAPTVKIIIHPPIKSEFRAFCASASNVLVPKSYITRNHDIVESIDFLLAFPATAVETVRSGTWATVRYARKRSKPMMVIPP